jgi:hypothetical protein
VLHKASERTKQLMSWSVKAPNKTRPKCDWWTVSIKEKAKWHKTYFFAAECVSTKPRQKEKAKMSERD